MDSFDERSEGKAVEDHGEGITLLNSFTAMDDGGRRVSFTDADLNGVAIAIKSEATC